MPPRSIPPARPKRPHEHDQQIDGALEAVRNLRCQFADTGRGFSELHRLGGALLGRLIAEELRICHAVSILFPGPGDVESPPTHDLQIVPPARRKSMNSQFPVSKFQVYDGPRLLLII